MNMNDTDYELMNKRAADLLEEVTALREENGNLKRIAELMDRNRRDWAKRVQELEADLASLRKEKVQLIKDLHIKNLNYEKAEREITTYQEREKIAALRAELASTQRRLEQAREAIDVALGNLRAINRGLADDETKWLGLPTAIRVLEATSPAAETSAESVQTNESKENKL
jgi:chromosome segregation ATPase